MKGSSLTSFNYWHAAYHESKKDINDNSLFSVTASRGQQVDATVEQCVEKLIECILLEQKTWVLIRHFDELAQKDPEQDDCARASKRLYDRFAHGALIDKTEFGNCGRSLLSVGDSWRSSSKEAICRQVGSTRRTIFLEPLEYVTSARHLRDYTKLDAGKLWSFESKRCVAGNFRACHPLAIDNHPVRRRQEGASHCFSGELCIVHCCKKNICSSRP